MRESKIESYLVGRVKANGGECVKLSWNGRRGAPDRLVMLKGRVLFVELKAPGGRCSPHQLQEHRRIQAQGIPIEVINSMDGVDGLMRELLNAVT